MTLQDFHRDIMPRPHKYVIFGNLPENKGLIEYTDDEPLLRQLQAYVATEDPKVHVLKQTKTAYTDTRYAAKMRLYTYACKKYGLAVTPYRPFEGTDIGINTPILNF